MTGIFSLKGKNILLTGGYGHFGHALAHGLASQGAYVAVLARDASKYKEVFGEAPRNIGYHPCDISDSKSIREAFAEIKGAGKSPHVLINNAFYTRGNDPEQLSDEDWDFGIDGTLSSTFRMIREVIPYFKANKGGKIINVSSMYGMVSPQFALYDDAPEQWNPPQYGAAKAGVIQLTKYYAAYLARYSVNVNCVSAGPFPKVSVQSNQSFVKKLQSMVPLGRLGVPEDLVGAFVYLSSEASNYVTGHNLVIDGGWTIC